MIPMPKADFIGRQLCHTEWDGAGVDEAAMAAMAGFLSFPFGRSMVSAVLGGLEHLTAQDVRSPARQRDTMQNPVKWCTAK